MSTDITEFEKAMDVAANKYGRGCIDPEPEDIFRVGAGWAHKWLNDNVLSNLAKVPTEPREKEMAKEILSLRAQIEGVTALRGIDAHNIKILTKMNTKLRASFETTRSENMSLKQEVDDMRAEIERNLLKYKDDLSAMIDRAALNGKLAFELQDERDKLRILAESYRAKLLKHGINPEEEK